jgi:DNA polymerase-3 subunit beta
VALLSNPKNYSICLEINTEQVRVYARTPELGEAYETVPVESSTGSVRIGFDARLLVEALAHIGSESLAIEFTGELNPVLIKPVSDDHYISLIMPMRLEAPAG